MSIASRLRDRVDILNKTNGAVLHADVPASVYVADSETPTETGRPNRLVETLRVIMTTDVEVNRLTMHLKWRNKVYSFDSDPMYRRRNGRDHHQTINLVRVEG